MTASEILSGWSLATRALICLQKILITPWNTRTDTNFVCHRYFEYLKKAMPVYCEHGQDTSENKLFTFNIQEFLKCWNSPSDALWNTQTRLSSVGAANNLSEFAQAAMTKYRRLMSETKETNFLAILKARSEKLKCHQGWLKTSTHSLCMASFSLSLHMHFLLCGGGVGERDRVR